MSFLAELRCEPERDEGSTADEGALPRGAGQIGLGHTARVFCEGHSLASPRRRKPEDRNYPETERWKGVHRDLYVITASCRALDGKGL